MNRYSNSFFRFGFPKFSYGYPNQIPPIKPTDHTTHLKNDNYAVNTDDSVLFEVLGIKLYRDDILILLIIYFLYKENTHDLILYILLFSLVFID